MAKRKSAEIANGLIEKKSAKAKNKTDTKTSPKRTRVKEFDNLPEASKLIERFNNGEHVIRINNVKSGINERNRRQMGAKLNKFVDARFDKINNEYIIWVSEKSIIHKISQKIFRQFYQKVKTIQDTLLLDRNDLPDGSSAGVERSLQHENSKYPNIIIKSIDNEFETLRNEAKYWIETKELEKYVNVFLAILVTTDENERVVSSKIEIYRRDSETKEAYLDASLEVFPEGNNEKGLEFTVNDILPCSSVMPRVEKSKTFNVNGQVVIDLNDIFEEIKKH